ncbi:hypothetical protein K8O93_01830 [Gordonia bronchialis]|uniref:hypothetical protein n=1 Tax=Gordonia bronchialis TaxID=2054 RepID=UPI001CBB454D|nr:hypothetical protein [Gordonia bronchialis]UAK38559.1 hypothetical protein K8O93_01830 [Gordonia bronchialis]
MTTPTAPTRGKDPLAALVAGVEQMLSELDEQQWAALVARVRPPADTDEPKDDEQKPAPKDDGPAYPANWGGRKDTSR